LRGILRSFSLAAVLAAITVTTGARAGTALERAVFSILSQRYPGAKLESVGLPRGISITTADQVESVEQVQEDGQGNASFFCRISGSETPVPASISFHAWITGWSPKNRVRPGEAVAEKDLLQRTVDVAVGPRREIRGLILTSDEPPQGLQSRQTLLEGEPILISAVEKIPDLRQGDQVKVRVIAGGITLSTIGLASQPASTGDRVNVVTQSTKRTLSGILGADHVVEVRL
jgi:flagella basal body P-ring formation protein FlgA